MHVLYLSYDGILDPLGQSQILPYIKCLAKKGVQFNLITLEKEEKMKSADASALKKELAENNIFWEHIIFAQKNNLPGVVKNLALMFFKSYRSVKNNSIQIIHCRSVTVFLGFLLKLATGKKLIFDARGFWFDERIERGMWKKGLLYQIGKKIEKILFIHSDSIVVLTHSMKKEIAHLNKNIEVIPTCVDTKLFKLIKKNHKSINFVYSGSVAEHYLIPEIIQFFYYASKEIPKSHLYFLINNNKEQVEKMLKEFNISDSQCTVLNMSYNKVPEFLSKAHFGITFLKKSYSSKGVAFTKVGEYLASGLCVVLNKGIGDYDEFLANNAIFIEDFNETEYKKCAEKIKNAVKNKTNTAVLRKMAEEYLDLEKGAEKYLKKYRDLEEKKY